MRHAVGAAALAPPIRHLADRFVVQEVLAEREYFSRYTARDEISGERRLIEIQRVEPEEETGWRARAALARRLEHEALLRCLEAEMISESRGLLAFEMPPAENATERLPPEQVARVGVSLSSLLALIHQVGLRFGAPVVDPIFWIQGESGPELRIEALARAVAGFRRESFCARCLLFIPPELVEGGQPSTAGDLFILGSLLHGLMRGSLPPSGGPLGVDPSGPGLEAEIARLLQPDPARRPASAVHVCRSFIGLLKTIPALADPPPAFGRIRPEGPLGTARSMAGAYVVPALSRGAVERLAEGEGESGQLELRLRQEIWGLPGADIRHRSEEERVRALEQSGEIAKALKIAGDSEFPLLKARLLWRAGRAAEAETLLENSSAPEANLLKAAMARERGLLRDAEEFLTASSQQRTACLVEQGWLSAASGKAPDAVEKFRQAVEIGGKPAEEARARGALGLQLARLGRLREAAEELFRAGELLRDGEEEACLREIRLWRAELDFLAGRWARARDLLEAQVAECRRSGDNLMLGASLLQLAELELASGSDASGERHVEEALKIARQRGDLAGKLGGWALLLEARALQRDWAGLLGQARALGRIPDGRTFPRERAKLWQWMARAALECGKIERARQALAEARALGGDLLEPALTAGLDAVVALWLARSGATEEAACLLERAIASLEGTSQPYALARLYAESCSWPLPGAPDSAAELRRLTAEKIARELGAEPLLRVLESRSRSPESSPDRPVIAGMIASSAPMLAALEHLERAAGFDIPVHFCGESGTGKELLARALHGRSARAQGRFVALNCAAFPDSLLDAELFGHARGAFTGADRERKGLLEEANRGTLFLDEVADLSPRGQTLLLRVIQEKEFRRLGESAVRRSDFWLVSATHRLLEEEVAAGRFREDLYFRLKVLVIEVPPLRERGADVLLLARSFLTRRAEEMGLPKPALSREVERALFGYGWPGNVRELENELTRSLIRLGSGNFLRPEHLSPRITGSRPSPLRSASVQFEKRFLQETLACYGGNRTRAARALGLTRQALYDKIRRHGLVTPPRGPGAGSSGDPLPELAG